MFILNNIRDEAIRNIYSETTTVRIDNDTDEYTATDSSNNPIVLDLTLVENEVDRLTAEYDALDYSRKRMSEYPSIAECVHAILDDDLENIQILRQAVKAKYPKND